MASQQEMDQAAVTAAEDLGLLKPECVAAVAEWWKRHYLKAGHKRLARALLTSVKTAVVSE